MKQSKSNPLVHDTTPKAQEKPKVQVQPMKVQVQMMEVEGLEEQDERMVLTSQDQENLLKQLEEGEKKQTDESEKVLKKEVTEKLEELAKKQ